MSLTCNCVALPAFLDLTEMVTKDAEQNTSLPSLAPELLLVRCSPSAELKHARGLILISPLLVCWADQTVDGTPLQPDVNPYDRLLVLAAARCHEIRQAVYDELGYTVSAGIGPNKVCVWL